MGDIADWDADRLCDPTDDEFQSNEQMILRYKRIARETDRAWLVVFDEDLPILRIQYWMPKSQCSINEKHRVIGAPMWLIEANELEEYVEE